MGFETSQELAMFTASREALRWLVSLKWQVTYFAMIAYVALTAAPRWISENAANGVRDLVNWGCAGLAALIAPIAWYHLFSLHRQHRDRLAECT